MTGAELHRYANWLLGSAVASYAITLGVGGQSAVGSMLMVLIGTGVHVRAARRGREAAEPRPTDPSDTKTETEVEEPEAACCDQGALVWPERCPWHPDGAPAPEPEPAAQPEPVTVWRAGKGSRTVPVDRDRPAVSTEPAAPNLTREDVRRLHGVYCYRDLNRRPDEPDHGRYGDPEREHPLSGCCICHHAVWHSCPDPQVGARMFEALPLRVSAQRTQHRTLDEADYVRHQLTEAQNEAEKYRRHLASVLDDLQRARRTP